jgi:predicted Zn-dependent protease
MQDVIRLYPQSDNTRNTAAWFASRALRRLDEAATHLKAALAARPEQPAYLDTMAEILFAQGQRSKALEWSARAVNFEPSDPMIRRQHERFRADPLPN